MDFQVAWPPLWLDVFDQFLPSWTKKRFSPDPRWADKPFSREDLTFFSKGIRELSTMLTEQRTEGGDRHFPDYFRHARFRSAYLLYFLPFQAGKFFSLYERHHSILQKSFRKVRTQKRPFRILDLGSGPATATVALLVWAFSRDGLEDQSFEIDLYDTNAKILEDGAALLKDLAAALDLPPEQIRVRTFAKPWWMAETAPDSTDLILLGHVLNEARAGMKEVVQGLEKLYRAQPLCGILIVEPASQATSHRLSRIRDHLIDAIFEPDDPDEAKPAAEPLPLLLHGPCLHSGACPLSHGRDWCHMSWPVEVPGKVYQQFTQMVTTGKRNWIKFSYLWFASRRLAPESVSPHERTVLSEPIIDHADAFILLCEPKEPARLKISKATQIYRGEVVDLRDLKLREPRNESRGEIRGEVRRPTGQSFRSKIAKKPSPKGGS